MMFFLHTKINPAKVSFEAFTKINESLERKLSVLLYNLGPIMLGPTFVKSAERFLFSIFTLLTLICKSQMSHLEVTS